MRILLYDCKAYSNRFLEENLKAMGYEITKWSNNAIMNGEEEALPYIGKELERGYDMVFSFNYFVVIATACHEKGVIYVSWTQDAPMLSLYDKTACFDSNYFFCFDYEQYEGLKNRGIKTAFYCPLATDTGFMQKIAGSVQPDEINKYKAQISFVGSLYTEKNLWNGMNGMPEFLKGYFDGFIETQLRIPALRFSQAQIPMDVMHSIHNVLNFEGSERSRIRYEELIDNLIDRQVTVVERGRMLKLLAARNGFKLYTNSDTSEYPEVNNCGSVDYYTEMPKVFRCSDININTTLRSIRSGIPLRVLDVIASGGFVLTNSQPEMEYFFKEGESIATFQSPEEMNEKIDYYLSHDEERRKIIENAYKIVESQFEFRVRLPEIFAQIKKG